MSIAFGLKEAGLLGSKEGIVWGKWNWGVISANACLGLDRFLGLTFFLSSAVDIYAISLTLDNQT